MLVVGVAGAIFLQPPFFKPVDMYIYIYICVCEREFFQCYCNIPYPLPSMGQSQISEAFDSFAILDLTIPGDLINVGLHRGT